MNRKSVVSVEWKADAAGAFVARFATIGVVDHDMDVTFAGAFPDGKAIPISSYGHESWTGALPTGKGVIGSDKKSAFVDGRFFTDTPHGLATYQTVKALGDLQEWSYGYDVLTETFDQEVLKEYPGATRGLVKLDVHEVSPVLKGAGIGTATLSIKNIDGLVPAGEFIIAEALAFKARATDRTVFRAKEGRRLSTATRSHLDTLATALTDAAAGLRTLLEEVDSDSGKSAVPADIQSIFAATEAQRSAELRHLQEELSIYVRAGSEA
jgi:hypothetical protein